MRVTQMLRRAAQMRGTAEAVSDGARRFTYLELQERCARLAGALRALGMAPGERVAMLAHSSHAYVEFYFGPAWGGFVIQPLNVRLALPELAAQLNDAEPCALIVDASFAATARELRPLVPSLRAVLHTGDAVPPDMLGYEAALLAATALEDAGAGGDDLAGLFYTGGTTGRAKGVMLSHRNLVANALNCVAHARLGTDLVQLHAGPLFHLAAGGRVYTAMLAAGRHVVIPRFDPTLVLETIATERVTAVTLVPTMFAMIDALPDFERHDLSSLRLIAYGSAPMPEPLLRRFMARLPKVGFINSYGMTELSPVCTCLDPDDHRAGRLRSAGRAVFSCEIRIVDAEDRELPRGMVGEIVVRGPVVMQGYWRQEALSAEALRGGWMHTGDLGEMDAEGYVYVVDRLKDMIITGGENVYSVEVERVIAEIPGVAACAVIGLPDANWGERVHAVIVAGDAPVDAATVLARCRAELASYKVPRSVEIRREGLPLSSVAKVDKRALRREVEGL